MTTEQFKERYLKFMQDYEAQLPADMPDAEKQEQVMAALEDFFNKDVESMVSEAEGELQELYDAAIIDAEKQNAQDHHDQLASVRQSL